MLIPTSIRRPQLIQSNEGNELPIELQLRDSQPEDFADAAAAQAIVAAQHKESNSKILNNLSQSQIDAVLKRLPEVDEGTARKDEYVAREATSADDRPKPATPGDISQIPVLFSDIDQSQEIPEDVSREMEQEKRADVPLKILRITPEGQITGAQAEIQITFSHPMIPLQSVKDTITDEPPKGIKMEPVIPGRWRWLGVKTLSFEPVHRLPKSTRFTVTFNASQIQSILGNKIESTVKHTFETSTPRVTAFVPREHDTIGVDSPLFYVRFDQHVDAEKIIRGQHLKIVQSSTSKSLGVRRLSPEEVDQRINKDDKFKYRYSNLYWQYKQHLSLDASTEQNQYGFWFTAEEKLSTASQYTITIGADVPSLEGPLTRNDKTEPLANARVSTYGPLCVGSFWPQSRIVPGQAWSINLTNSIDAELFDEATMVKIEPELPERNVLVSGNSVTIQGRSKGRTTYKITFDSKVIDMFGQSIDTSKNTATFEVGQAAQTLQTFATGMVVLDPTDTRSPPTHSIVVVNVDTIRLLVFQVEPKDLFQSPFHRYASGNCSAEQFIQCGKKVHDGVVATGCEPDTPKEVNIDLSKFLQHQAQKRGQLIVYVEPGNEKAWKETQWDYRQRLWNWIQVTGLAVETFYDSYGGKLLSFVNAMAASGSPLKGVGVELLAGQANRPGVAAQIAATDEHGVATIDAKPLTKVETNASEFIAVARSSDGIDVAIVQNAAQHLQRDATQHVGYIVNDRGMYKPKETANIKGIIRDIHYDADNISWSHKVPSDLTLKYEVLDARYAKILEGEVKTNSYGAFALQIPLPDNMNLGNCQVTFHAHEAYYYHSFQVQEFRTPEFSASAHVVTASNKLIGDGHCVVKASASLYSGGTLNGAKAMWSVTANASSYTPPGWSEYRFKRQTNWWYSSLESNSSVMGEHSGITDSNGQHHLTVEFKHKDTTSQPSPITVRCETAIQDLNRQTINASTQFLVHPANFYVGIKALSRTYNAGKPAAFDLVVADIDGRGIGDVEITVQLQHKEYVQKGFSQTSKDVVDEKKTIKTSENGEARISFDLSEQFPTGSATVLVSIKDNQNRAAASGIDFFVLGSSPAHGLEKSVAKKVTVVPDKDLYEPGDVAKLLVQAPFAEPCQLVVLAQTCAVVHMSYHALKDTNCTLVSIPIKEEYLPSLSVMAYVVGSEERTDEAGAAATNAPRKPAHGSSVIQLSISRATKTLKVDVTPETQNLAPGESTQVSVKVANKDGTAVADAEVCLIAVDEAVLSLSNHTLGDPVYAFYPSHHGYMHQATNRSVLFFKSWDRISIRGPPEPQKRMMMFRKGGGGGAVPEMAMMASFSAAPGAAMQMAGMAATPIAHEGTTLELAQDAMFEDEECEECDEEGGTVSEGPAVRARKNFSPVAAFVASVQTDSEGVARIKVDLPDNLTRFRIWAISHNKDGTKFGLGESFLVSSLPLMVRCSLPRFVNFGDKFQGTVILQNQTQRDLVLQSVARANNMTTGQSQEVVGYRVLLAANDRFELRFPLQTVAPGEAVFQCGAIVEQGADFADAATVRMPVYTPATTEGFATYGEIDGDGECMFQKVIVPEDVFPNFGGLKIQMSSTAMQNLESAFIYLYNYEYSCVEQTASRILSMLAMGPLVEAFHSEGMPTKDEIHTSILSGLDRIKQSQRDDGSFGFWSGSYEPSLFVTTHVALCFVRCKMQGHTVDDSSFKRVLAFVAEMDKHVAARESRLGGDVSLWNKANNFGLRAFALYVQALADRYLFGNTGSSKLVNSAKSLFTEMKNYKPSITKDGHGAQYEIDLESAAWIMQTIFNCNSQQVQDAVIQEILKFINNRVHEEAGTAHFVTGTSDKVATSFVLLRSDRRTDGVVLDALLDIDVHKQQKDLMTKLVKGLLAHRRKNKHARWNNTQENLWVLFALKKYFEVYESAVPDYQTNVWIQEQFIGQKTFKGRETEEKLLQVPMKKLLASPSEDKTGSLLIMQKQGKPGRLYYRLGLDYALKNFKLDPLECGFQVTRTYEPISDPSHVQFDAANGHWNFKLGELIRVRITLVNTSRRYHVALVDKLPAGCEVLNAALATTGTVPSDDKEPQTGFWWYRRSWYEQENLRDERAEAFTELLWEGSHNYSYVMRATALGEFQVPPVKVEEMYSPEIFARSKNEVVYIV